jgi:uncharacterized protein
MTTRPLPWLRFRRKTEPELPVEPPIWLGGASNGEIFHRPSARDALIRRMVLERAGSAARRLGVDRRQFLASGAGMATTLSVINLITGGCGRGGDGSGGPGRGTGDAAAGGRFEVGSDPLDAAEQCQVGLDPAREFIFDIQSHHFADRPVSAAYQQFLTSLPQAQCGRGVRGCFVRNEYVRRMFLESDTTVAVLSAVPAVEGQNPLTNEEIAQSRDIINMLAGSQRLVNHCIVLPNHDQPRQLEGMQRAHEQYRVGAWKCYTPWGPTGEGWFLDDERVGIPFIRRGLELGVRTFCCHKGLPLPGFSAAHADPRDVGVVARMFPDASFVIYHSAFQFGGTAPEGPYTEGSRVGVNSLITAMRQQGVGPNQNVHAELGTTWYLLMRDPTAAAHVLGKLLLHVGEDNILWGTDSIWYGSPQPQIEAFLRFQITPQLQQQHGYPALTAEIRRKILGLNAARVYGIDPRAVRCGIKGSDLAAAKDELDAEWGARRWALDRPYITTRRQFLDHVRRHGDTP